MFENNKVGTNKVRSPVNIKKLQDNRIGIPISPKHKSNDSTVRPDMTLLDGENVEETKTNETQNFKSLH